MAGLTNEQQTSVWAHDLIKPFSGKGSFGSCSNVGRKFSAHSEESAMALKLVTSDMEFVRKNL